MSQFLLLALLKYMYFLGPSSSTMIEVGWHKLILVYELPWSFPFLRYSV